MNIYIDDQVRKFLSENKGQWLHIAEQTGVKQQWICKVMDGRIKDPGVSRLKKILNYAYSTGWQYQDCA